MTGHRELLAKITKCDGIIPFKQNSLHIGEAVFKKDQG